MPELSSSDAADLPEVLAPVVLRLALPNGAAAELPSRVCDVEERDGVRRVVVHKPDVTPLAEPGTFPRPDDEVALLWPLASAQMRLPVTATPAARPYGSVWVLTPAGAPTREQRREFFRVPLTLPAVLAPVVDGVRADDAAVLAALVEIGEGGAVVHHDDALPEPGTVVELTFTLHDKTITVDAEVLRREMSAAGGPRAALRFLDPETYGDHIRRAAFAVQRSRARAATKPT